MGTAQVASARSILHRRVKNPRGEELGHIEELVIDLDRGFIAYALLMAGELAQPTAKCFVIPWGSFSVDPRDRTLVLDLEREVLDDAAGLDRDTMLSVGVDAPSLR